MQRLRTLTRVFLLSALISGTSLLFAASKSAQLSGDTSIKMSDRQAVLGLSILGLGAKNFRFPVYFTPLGGYKHNVGTWDVFIPQRYADEMLESQLPILISNRFDKIVFGPQNASIYTATKDVTVAYAGAPRFDFRPGSFEIFLKEVNAYLNQEIAPQVVKVLDAAKDARYSQMSKDEAQSFIQSKAKESGIPVAILEKLVSSSYVFATYLPALQGSLEIEHIEKTNFITGKKSRVFRTTFHAPLHTKLAIYKFDGNSFTHSGTIDSEANGDLFGAMAKSISGSASRERSFMPLERDAQKLFDEVFAVSLKDSLIAIGTRLKADRSFAISAPLEDVQGSSATLAVGNQEDIRVDHPFTIYRTIDGKEVDVGTIKVSKPGNNCALLDPQVKTKSEAVVINGNIEAFDLAVEHPWTGVFGSLFVKQTEGNYLFNNSDTGSGKSMTLNVGFNADLGYLLNSQGMREMWMNLDVGFGAATYGNAMPNVVEGLNTYTPSSSSALGVRAAFGLEKRLNLFSGTFLAIGADIGYEAQVYGYSSSQSLYLTSVEAIPRVKLGMNLGIDKELSIAAGYSFPFAVGAIFGDDQSTGEVAGFTRNSGLDLRVAFSYHVDFAGPFAKMMATPSKACDALK